MRPLEKLTSPPPCDPLDLGRVSNASELTAPGLLPSAIANAAGLIPRGCQSGTPLRSHRAGATPDCSPLALGRRRKRHPGLPGASVRPTQGGCA